MRYVLRNEEVNMTSNEVIARVSDRGIIKIISRIHIEALSLTIDYIPPFNE